MKGKYEYLNDVKTDFSQYENMELSESEVMNMKRNVMKRTIKKLSVKKCIVLAACIACIIAVTQSAFAGGVFRMKKQETTGHNIFYQMEYDEDEYSRPVPEELAGQIFDKDGNEIKEFTRDTEELFDKNGNAIGISVETNDGKTEYKIEKNTNTAQKPETNEKMTVFDTLEEVKAAAGFNVLVPEILPEGYEFFYGVGYKDEDGNVSRDYAAFYYSNGTDTISVHERIINDETAFETAVTEDIKTADVNGNKAVYDSTMISWEADGVSVSIISRTEGDMLLDMARSAK